jgi:dihydrofolate reductase
MSKDISIIVAIAKNRAIGKDNDLLWHISDDLKRFKQITMNHKIIMGRNTYDSLPFKPLPKRESIVISRTQNYDCPKCRTVKSIEEAIELMDTEKENFVIGGAQIYKEFLNKANKLYLTVVHQDFDADVYFPEFNKNDWKLIEEEHHKDAELPYSFLTYEK